MAKRRWLGAVVVLLLGAETSAAGTLSITYDLSSSVPGLNPPLPAGAAGLPFGPTSGVLMLTLTGVDASGALVGGPAAATLSGLALSTSLIADLEVLDPVAFADTTLTRTFDFMQVGLSNGLFDGETLQLDPFDLNESIAETCAGPACGTIAPFSPLLQSISSPEDFALVLLALDRPGASAFSAQGQIMFGLAVIVPVLGTLQLSGREVARGFVAEPSSAGLLSLALSLLWRRAARVVTRRCE